MRTLTSQTVGLSSSCRHESHELDPVSIWMSQGSDFTAQVCASPLPLLQHLGPKAARIKRPLLASPKTLSGPPAPGQACWGFRQLCLRWAWQRQDYDTNIQLPTFKVSIPGGPVDSNIPSWSGDGETCSLQRLSNQAECKVVTSRRQPNSHG